MNVNKLLSLELDENCLDYHGLLNINFNNTICRLSGGNIENIPNDTELIIILTIDNQIKNLNIERIEIIYYPICDFNVPEINSFKELISNIRHKIINEKINKIHVACEHGHGRTGMLLVALLVDLLNIKVEDAINFVKNYYCDKNIETDEQLEFVLNLNKGEEYERF